MAIRVLRRGKHTALAWGIVKKNKPLAKAIILKVVSEGRKYLLKQLDLLNERIRALEEIHSLERPHIAVI